MVLAVCRDFEQVPSVALRTVYSSGCRDGDRGAGPRKREHHARDLCRKAA